MSFLIFSISSFEFLATANSKDSSIRPRVSPIRTTVFTLSCSTIAVAHSVNSECFSLPPAIKTIGSLNDLIAAIQVSGVVEKESLKYLFP